MTGQDLHPSASSSQRSTVTCPRGPQGVTESIRAVDRSCEEGSAKVPPQQPSFCPFRRPWRAVPAERHCWGRKDGEDHGLEPAPVLAPLGPPGPGAGGEDFRVVLNLPRSGPGPFCSLQAQGQLQELGRRSPANLPGAGVSASPQSHPPDQTQLPFRAALFPLPATCPQRPHFPLQAE